MFNPHTDSVSGTATLTVGGRKVATKRVFVISQDAIDFPVSAKVAKAIRRGAKAVVSATVEGGERDTTPVAFAHPVTTAFDGTYRGSGPLVIKVRGGIVTVASKSLFLASTRGTGNMTRLFSLPVGIPAIVGRNGTVKVHGDSGSDEVRFNATFRRNGTAKGYLSLWYYHHAVVDERRQGGLAHAGLLEVDRLREAVEQALAAAEDHGRDDDRQLVDQPGGERLADHVGAAHDVDVLVARRLARAGDRVLDAVDEHERVAVRLVAGSVRDDEERQAPRVAVAPAAGRLVGEAPADDGADALHGVLEPAGVLRRRIAAGLVVVAPRAAEDPVVQALAARAEPLPVPVVRTGDVAVD
jgi:hypothetical protein